MAVDDGARTRYLGRDSREEARNLLESGGTDGSFQCPEELSVNDDVPYCARAAALLISAFRPNRLENTFRPSAAISRFRAGQCPARWQPNISRLLS